MGGVQKLFYLPEPHTDFIFAVIGEELGLLGTTVVLVCFCVIAWRGLRGTMLAPDVRRVPRAWPHDDDRASGVREHQRRTRDAADQRDHAAARQQRRIVAPDQPAGLGCAAEHLAARDTGKRVGSDPGPARGERAA